VAAAAGQQNQQPPPAQQQASLARSVRPIPITVITVAKGSSKGAELMAGEWADKLRRYTQLTELQVGAACCWRTGPICRQSSAPHLHPVLLPAAASMLLRMQLHAHNILATAAPCPLPQVKPNPKNAKETSVAVVHEGERVLKSLQPSDRVVLLDERGRDASSEDIARLLAQVGRDDSGGGMLRGSGGNAVMR
jgi:23S rRNA pseudoU1915 N3-methylase RlmH